MKKLNNKGLTLIELLVSLAVLSIFMITVTYFVTATTRSTKKTKQQLTVQQESKEVYETLRDTIMQASCLVINTTGLASGDASGSAPAGTVSGDADTLIRKTSGFEAALAASGTEVQLVSNAAFDTMSYVKEAQASAPGGGSSDDRTDFIDNHDNPTIGNPTKYQRDATGKITAEKTRKLSVAQYVGGLSIYDATATEEFAAFDDREYEVSALSMGPIMETSHMSINDVKKYNTIIFDKSKGKLYLNRPKATAGCGFLDFSKDKKYVISDNCIGFTVKVTSNNTLYLKLTFRYDTRDSAGSVIAENAGGYTYTVGGAINMRNGNVMK